MILVGRLTRDPEVRYTQSGTAVATFGLAVNRIGAKEGQQQVDFIEIVAWSKLAEICGNNLAKGRKILVEGRLQVRTYETNDGQKRRVSEVIAQNVEFLESKQSGQAEQTEHNNPFGGEEFPEEEIPF